MATQSDCDHTGTLFNGKPEGDCDHTGTLFNSNPEGDCDQPCGNTNSCRVAVKRWIDNPGRSHAITEAFCRVETQSPMSNATG